MVVEATGNASAVAEVIAPHVGRVVIANPRQVRLIAQAKIKTDVIDATVLAQLYASGFLPEVWVPDEPTQALRRQVTRRNQIVRQRARLKTIIQSILHAHLMPPCPHADLFGTKGRAWLLAQAIPEDERDAVERHLREYDRLSEDLRVIERELARDALADADVKRLMTIPGIDMVVAVGLTAAIGPDRAVRRARTSWCAYLGLNPSVHQSGEGRPQHGRITKQGRTHARTMLVEAAWQAVRGPGPLRAFYQRVSCPTRRPHRRRRGRPQARRDHLAPAQQGRGLRLGASGAARQEAARSGTALGQPARRGQRGSAYAYNLTHARQEDDSDGSSRPRWPIAGSPRAGPGEDGGCPRAPQTRSDHEGCAAGLAPHALLFATRSPVGSRKIARHHAKRAVQSHPWSRDDWAW